MSDYIIHNGTLMSEELYHYGVKGMKWGHRRAQRYENKARIARESAKEWDEMSKYASAKGKTRKANRYAYNASSDRVDAKQYANKAAQQNRKNNFKDARKDASKARSRGAKVATVALAGPFANKTYNSVIAAGGTKAGARAITALASAAGPLGHLVVSGAYTSAAGKKKLANQH